MGAARIAARGLGAVLLPLLLGAAPAPALEMPPPRPREAWPVAEVSVGVSVLSRSALLCAAPLQTWCGSDANLAFTTDAPYLGAELQLTAFPFAQVEAEEWRGLGVEGRYGWAAIQVSDGTATALAIDQAWAAEALYRQPLELWGWRPWVGARVGAASRRFAVPDAVEGLQVRRGIGPEVGLDAGMALMGPSLRLELSARYAMGANPGPAERELYGDGASTDAYTWSAGLSGAFVSSGWFGWSATLEQQLFLDTYRGSGTRAPRGAWVMERYTALTAGLRYRF